MHFKVHIKSQLKLFLIVKAKKQAVLDLVYRAAHQVLLPT